ncbi:MAG: alpha/beta fold hydrolase [Nitriliruptoraceae bacterium]
MRRVLLWALLPMAVLTVGGLGAGGWYYSDQLLPASPPFEPVPDITITAVDDEAGELTLATAGGDLALHTVGLVTDTGLLLANGGPAAGEAETTRTATLLEGEWPAPGDAATTTIATFHGDPATSLGLPFDTVSVASEIGALPAWRVVPHGAPTDETWAIIVHGRGAGLSEGNRLLPVFDDLAVPSLSISVRNSPDAPADPRGFGYYGEREWLELEAAIAHLVEVEGAQDVVLVGYSQGGSVALSLLRRSAQAERVAAAVLISPLVSLEATLDLQARNRGIPEAVIPALLTSTRWISTWRAGLDFSQVEHAERADALPDDVPILITHGDADTTVPVEPSRELAALLGDQVTYVEYADVDHVREWNSDPERFEEDLRELLATALG